MSADARLEQAATAENPAASETVLLKWTVHHLRRDPRKGALVAAALALAAGAGWYLFGSWLIAAAAVLMLLSSTAEFLFPIRACITNRRITSTCGAARLEMRWEDVRRVMIGEDGIKVTPLARPGRLDNFRGIELRTEGADPAVTRDQILDHVRSLRPELLS